MALYDILLAQKLGGSNASKSMISDAYDSTKTYAVGDYCIYNNTLYICKTAITTAEEWTPAHWDATNCTTELSELKGTLTDYQSTTSCTPSSGVTVRNFKAERVGNLVIITAQIDITSAKSNGDILLSWSGSQYEMKGYSYQVCRSTSGYYSVNCSGGNRRLECGNSGIEVSNWLSMTFVGVAKNI